MPKITAISFLTSLAFCGIGNSGLLALQNSTRYVNAGDSNLHVLLTVSYFVLTIFFAVIGFVFYFYNFYIRNLRENEVSGISDIEIEEKSVDNSNDRRFGLLI